MDSTIKVLPPHLANLIAAGEVVQRPASVVKELVENAIDAGATKVQVVILGGGRTLIQVIDNGRGMSADEATLCFERHATSKLQSEEDLHRILTFGFRGEALPSIASVAKVTLKTKRAADELATTVVMEAGQLVETRSAAAPDGTNIMVRDLFYNIPARRKFLKSDNVELRHITDEFIRVALRSKDVALKLTVDEKVLYDLRPAISEKARLRDIFGESIIASLVDISSESEVVNIHGFISLPEGARKTGYRQFMFAGGRYFRSAYFHKAILQSFENLIPDGSQPSYCLFFDIDPSKIDVNIHPSKIEIKFEDESLIYNILAAAVRQTVGVGALSGTIDFSLSSEIEMPAIDKSFAAYEPSEPTLKVSSTYNPFSYGGTPGGYSHEPRQDYSALFPTVGQEGFPEAGGLSDYHAPYGDSPAPYGDNFKSNSGITGTFIDPAAAPSQGRCLVFDSGRSFATVHNDKLLVINTFRAYKRVFYDSCFDALKARAAESQPLIFPLIISMSPAEMLAVSAYSADLKRVGVEANFNYEDNFVEITAKPYSLTDSYVRDLVEALKEEDASFDDALCSSLALKMADSAALKAVNSAKMSLGGFSEAAAQDLLLNLFASSDPEKDPSGNVIITNVKTD